MNIKISLDSKSLSDGLDGFKTSILGYLDGAGCRLSNIAKSTWRNSLATESVLSNGRNGREWFSFDKKTWYWTNKWKTPNPVWAGRNFLKNKRKQANIVMAKIIGQKKQEELEMAIDEAINNFK
ncbi:MAG: hypothetical protein EBZ87_00310 [Microbacteriaceae bacterium]|nr:hypothetical protein [Microbacteriaceae bacterium]